MFYNLLYPLADVFTPFNIFRYNKIFHSNAYGLGFSYYNGYSSGSSNRVYNNTIFNSDESGAWVDGNNNTVKGNTINEAPIGVHFFGTGNISFTGGVSAFIPTGPQGASVPVISPFFGDVDTRNPLSGVMHVRTDIANEIIVTWDAVGRFASHGDLLDSFQLVVRGPGYSIPVGEGAIGFFYKSMQWDDTVSAGG